MFGPFHSPVPFFFRQVPTESSPLPVMAVDEETTGLNLDRDGRRHDRNSLAQIGAVDLPTGKSFYGVCRPRPGAVIDQEALAVNGITMDELMDPAKPEEGDLIHAFKEWCRKVTEEGLASGRTESVMRLLGGINPRFDLEFLHTSSRHAGMSPKDFPFGRRTMAVEDLCVHEAARRGLPIPDKGFNTDKCYLLLGLPCEPRPHNAFAGALYGARCLDEFMPASGGAPRVIEAPTLFGVDRAPNVADPFLVESVRRSLDNASRLLLVRGGPACEVALLDVPTRIEGSGKRQCVNPAFRASYASLARLAKEGAHPVYGYGPSREEMQDQTEALALEWAQMDREVSARKAQEKQAAPAVSEGSVVGIAGLMPPEISEPARTVTLPGPQVDSVAV